MSIKKELVKSFKNLLSAYFAKVYSATELVVTDKTVGSDVQLVDSTGVSAPAPDGDYVMEDGFSFTVKDGKIESIIGEEQPVEVVEPVDAAIEVVPAEEPVVEVPIEEVPEVEEVPEEDITDAKMMELEMKVTELETKFSELSAKVDELSAQKMEAEQAVENFNKVVNELNTNMKTLANIPVQFSKVSNDVKQVETNNENINNLINILGKKK